MTAGARPSPRLDTVAVAIVAGWLLGAFLADTAGLWIGLGATAILLGITTVAVCGRDLDAWRISSRALATGAVTGVAMTMATLVVFEPAAALVPSLRADVAGLYAAMGHPRAATTLVILPLIVVAEEIVWRGAVFQALSTRLSWAGAIVAGSILYALAHVPVGSPALVATCVGVGLCWSALRAWTNSLPAVILAHLIWNGGVLVLNPVV